MTLRSLAHAAQLHLEERAGCALKRTHVLELLAALFGHHSWNGLRAKHLLADAGVGAAPNAKAASLLGRALQLGYPQTAALTIAESLPLFAAERGLGQISWDGLYRLLAHQISAQEQRDYTWEDEDPFGEEDQPPSRPGAALLASPLLLSSLETMAGGGLAKAHYMLACLYRCGRPNSYLYEESLKGRQLNSAEMAFVAQYHVALPRFERFYLHLTEAARLGVRAAAVELVTDLPSADAHALLAGCSDLADPPEVVNVAPTADSRRRRVRAAADRGDLNALHVLASSGDVPSLERLAAVGDERTLYELAHDAFERGDKLAVWTWHHLALLYHYDMRKSTMMVYHADGDREGQFYDSDFGGAVYADGDEGLELPEADEALQRAAADAAAARYAAAHARRRR
jgi:hypothetical protein